MTIYNFFVRILSLSSPKTPNTAIAGIKKGILPKESFINSSLFLNSPFDSFGKAETLTEAEDFDRLVELERILSKKNIDLETEIVLFKTLNELVEHINPEIALFAAESINSIENRYNKDIYELKRRVDDKTLLDLIKVIDLIKLYYRYGTINEKKEDLKRVYYTEALNYIEKSNIDASSDVFLLKIVIKIYNYFKFYSKAKVLVTSAKIEYWQIMLMLIEIEFEARNFDNLYHIIDGIDIDRIPLEFQDRINLWKR